jgi:IS605 OrfB family transposase
LTKSPAIIVTEDLGEKPQDEMINGVGKGELRHRIKQTPFKSIEEAVEDKALERGSKLFRVSSYRNSRICPIHFVRLERTDDWHTLKCPLGHLVDRDYTSVTNMLWKITPKAWTKGVWWNMKKNMNWRKHEDKSNLIIPYEIVQYLHTTLKEFKASEQSPAMLARGKPMNPARQADEGWARKPPKKGGGQTHITCELIRHAVERLRLRAYELRNSGICQDDFEHEILKIINEYACNGVYDRKSNDRLYLCKSLQKCVNIVVIVIFTVQNKYYKIITVIPTTNMKTIKRKCQA